MEDSEILIPDDNALTNILKFSINGVINYSFNDTLNQVRLFSGQTFSRRNLQITVPNACAFMQHFIAQEHMYLTLSFIKKKKSKMEGQYDRAVLLCRKFMSSVRTHPTMKFNETQELMESLDYLQNYLRIKREAVSIYLDLSSAHLWKRENLNEIQIRLNKIFSNFKLKKNSNTQLATLDVLFRGEIKTCKSLILAYEKIENYDFKNSTFMLYFAKQNLNAWLSTAYNIDKMQSTSIYHWMSSMYDWLLAKQTLYFYRVIRLHAPENLILSNRDPKFSLLNKIIKFQKKNDNLTIALVFNAMDCPIHADGYRVSPPKNEDYVSKDLKLIFSWPLHGLTEKQESNIAFTAIEKWDVMEDGEVMYLRDDLNEPPVTYFVMVLDAFVCLALVFVGRKSDNDKQVHEFLHDFRHLLRCSNLSENCMTKEVLKEQKKKK